MSDVNVELGLPSTTSITLNDTAVRNLAGIPSGAISMNDLRGKSAGYKYIAYAFTGSYTGSPRIAIYPWSNATGFGVRFANPTSAPTNIAYSVDTYGNSSGDILYGGASTAGYVQGWKWSSSGFGTKYANPAVIGPGSVREVRFSPNGQTVVSASTITSPYLSAYAYTQGSGFGTKYSDPATLPTSSQYNVSWNGDGTVAICGLGTTNALNVYPFSGGFGTRYANPSSAAGSSYGMRFYTGGGITVFAGGRTSTPFSQAYVWSNGFGTKFANPATAPLGLSNDAAISEDGSYIAIAHDDFPYVTAYPWSNSTGFGTKYANPSTNIGGNAESVGWQKGASVLGITMSAGDFVSAYSWSSSGFGSRYAKYTTDPATNQPNGTVSDMKFFGT